MIYFSLKFIYILLTKDEHKVEYKTNF